MVLSWHSEFGRYLPRRWFAKRFVHPDVVEPYDYIFIWDEDLGLEHFNATRWVTPNPQKKPWIEQSLGREHTSSAAFWSKCLQSVSESRSGASLLCGIIQGFYFEASSNILCCWPHFDSHDKRVLEHPHAKLRTAAEQLTPVLRNEVIPEWYFCEIQPFQHVSIPEQKPEKGWKCYKLVHTDSHVPTVHFPVVAISSRSIADPAPARPVWDSVCAWIAEYMRRYPERVR